MKIALVTDSACDLPSDLVSTHQIHVVPNILIMDGISVEDNKDFSRRDFYLQLPKMKTFPTTSTASIGTYQALYEQLIGDGFDRIISIHVSQVLSGIFNAASTAAQAMEGRVTVIDSQQVSLGLGFQILEAAEAITQGMTPESIVELLESARQRTKLIAMLDTLEYIRRSGRVSWAKARIGALLNLKPFVEVKDGNVHTLGEVRTRKKGKARLLSMMQSPKSLQRFGMLHTNSEEDARKLLASLASEVQSDPLMVNVTTAIGAHVGPNGLGFVALYQDETHQT
jgi:DegV family protein with EDD domain